MRIDVDALMKVAVAAAKVGSMDSVDGGVWQKQEGELGVRVSPDCFVIARSYSWARVEELTAFIEKFCPRTVVFLLMEITKLRQLLAQTQDESAARILRMSAISMDIRQMCEEFSDNGYIFEPDETWPADDVRRLVIQLMKGKL